VADVIADLVRKPRPTVSVGSVATPVNWKDGDDCIIVPAVSDEDAREKFPAGWTAVKPYLRITPQPNKVKGDSNSA
jgi:hypothetical protein